MPRIILPCTVPLDCLARNPQFRPLCSVVEEGVCKFNKFTVGSSASFGLLGIYYSAWITVAREGVEEGEAIE